MVVGPGNTLTILGAGDNTGTLLIDGAIFNPGISLYGTLNIAGGTVKVTLGNAVSLSGTSAIGGTNRTINFTGGHVTAIGAKAPGIEGALTIDWTNRDDTFEASSYSGNVIISGDKTMAVPETGEVYTGTLTDAQKSEIAGKTLCPQFYIDSNSTSLNNGCHILNSNVTVSERISVAGDVRLVLMDGFTLNVPKGINVAGNNRLTIYGPGNGTGKLTISGGAVEDGCAGIGGGDYGVNSNQYDGRNYGGSGIITINGGTVNATGGDTNLGEGGAGIGGGACGNGGTIIINGGKVTANGGTGAGGIGGGMWSGSRSISLGWTNTTDSIYASSYSGPVTLTSGFLIDGANPETVATSGNVGGKKIVASTRVHAVTADEGIPAVPWVLEGSTVTLTSKKGYDAVYTVNGTAIEGDTFTMPAKNVTITATFTPIVYTITYELNGGSASNPATYTVESDAITLTNPTKNGYVFTGWIEDINGTSKNVTIPAGSTGDRSYTAKWGESVSYIDANGNEQTCNTYTSVTSGSTSWTEGWYIVESDVTIGSRITVSGTVHLILADGLTLTAPKGIEVAKGNSLTIYG